MTDREPIARKVWAEVGDWSNDRAIERLIDAEIARDTALADIEVYQQERLDILADAEALLAERDELRRLLELLILHDGGHSSEDFDAAILLETRTKVLELLGKV